MRLRLINETKKDKDFFTYVSVAKELWHKKVQDEQDEVNINFDLENDDAITQREIVVDQSHWEFTKCKFRAEMRKAGGDWQSPVVYFRVQLVDGYATRNGKDLSEYNESGYFVFIPGKYQGNIHLDKTKSGWSAPDSDCKTEPSEHKAWQALKTHLRKLVDDAIAESGK